jgi:hypothetical protein
MLEITLVLLTNAQKPNYPSLVQNPVGNTNLTYTQKPSCSTEENNQIKIFQNTVGTNLFTYFQNMLLKPHFFPRCGWWIGSKMWLVNRVISFPKYGWRIPNFFSKLFFANSKQLMTNQKLY